MTEVQTIEVQAQPDHISSLTRSNPLSALLEMIWNSLDADAQRVTIIVERDPLGAPKRIVVEDDGMGLEHQEVSNAFGYLGGSWKKQALRTRQEHRLLHGREGRGRFKALALGRTACWNIIYKSNGDLYKYKVHISKTDVSHCQLEPPEKIQGGTTGTIVEIEDLVVRDSFLSDDNKIAEDLSEHLALYLRKYPTVTINYESQKIDPFQFEKNFTSLTMSDVQIEPGKLVNAELEIVEWNTKRDRKLYLCRMDGFTVLEMPPNIRPGREFSFTVYLRSQYIEELEEQNILDVAELDQGLNELLKEAKKVIKAYFRKQKAQEAAELVSAWKEEGVYPFRDEPKDEIGIAKRQVFDICAFSVNEYLSDFSESEKASKKLTFRMLREALEANPSALRMILGEVLSLPKEKQDELAEILEETSLSGIIEASKLVTERLSFLRGLEELLFDSKSKKELKERSQLHKILENESWIFGEEYHLTASDEGLTTVLKKHLKRLRPEDKIEEVQRDDGSRGTIDLLLAREVPQQGKNEREFLVVELKRPSQKIDLAVKGQIESYALAVVRDERFDKINTKWTFLAVSNEMTSDAEETISQSDKPFGFFLSKDQYRVGLVTWAEVLQRCRTRMELFKEKLGYNASRDQGLEVLKKKYEQYLPKALLDDNPLNEDK